MKMPSFMRANVPLASYSTLGVGGTADYFADIVGVGGCEGDKISASPKLLEVYEFARENNLDVFVLGGGSNILFSDNYFRGLVIRMSSDAMMPIIRDKYLWVDSGTMVSELVKMSRNVGLTGFEWAAGLPGTVGGAVYGNAGCFGGQFWDLVEQVVFFDGEYVKKITNKVGMFSYRRSVFKENPSWNILSVRLSTNLKGKKLVAGEIRRIKERRSAVQPMSRSAGCIFKNPKDGDSRTSAGRLIELSGLKGTRIGNAMISNDHGNFFINLGGAKADNFIDLIKVAKSVVYEKYDVLLEEEIIRVGEF